MSASDWATWFPKEETLHTEIRDKPFVLLAATRKGIRLRAPAKDGAEFWLPYDHLDALWELRAWAKDRIAKNTLNRTVNQVFKDRGLKDDQTHEAQYWALVCVREHRQYGPSPDVDSEATEGNPRLVTHLSRERRSSLVAKKKATAGKLICEACNFSFAEQYPGLGENFCEVHHNRPLAEGPRITSLEELAILCSNCHRMIHRAVPMETVDVFRMRLKKLADAVRH